MTLRAARAPTIAKSLDVAGPRTALSALDIIAPG